MKIFGKYLLMSAIALGLWSCSDDAPEVNSPDDPVDEVYMSVKIQLPTSGGSRSTTTGDNTSSDGTEVGKDFENNVSSVLIILAEPTTHKLIAYKEVNNPTYSGSTATAKGTFIKEDLIDYLTANGENRNIEIFAFCNYTNNLLDAIKAIKTDEQKSKWFDNLTHTVSNSQYSWSDQDSNEAIWKKNSFLMANRDIAEGTLPTLEKIKKGDYSTPSQAFPLTGESGSVAVQRSVARFDFKDGSPTTTPANTYNYATSGANPTLQITLTKMSLVNLSKTFYHLMRTSSDGLTTTTKLCGADNTTSWVVDTDAEFKSGYAGTDASNNFFYWTDASNWKPGNWDTCNISDVINSDNEDQNYEGWFPEDKRKPGYKIWRYVTENTIPSETGNQKNGITTGVIFEGVLKCTAAADQSLKDAMTAHNDLYAFGGKFYGNWNSVGEYVTKNINKPEYTDLIVAYKKCITAGTDDELRTNRVSNGFAVYRYDEVQNGYPMHYYYWNRHNDNNNSGEMGHMEFQVVRNNIYKLQVTDISGLGHPTKPGDDPDPFDPNDPDEKEDVYFSVAVSIVPWVVRVNNIEF